MTHVKHVKHRKFIHLCSFLNPKCGCILAFNQKLYLFSIESNETKKKLFWSFAFKCLSFQSKSSSIMMITMRNGSHFQFASIFFAIHMNFLVLFKSRRKKRSRTILMRFAVFHTLYLTANKICIASYLKKNSFGGRAFHVAITHWTDHFRNEKRTAYLRWWNFNS